MNRCASSSGRRRKAVSGVSSHLQVPDPEHHFADGSTVCWRVVSIPVHHSRTTPHRKPALRRYQFSSCSKHRQGVLDFAGKSGPSTLFELDVERGYDISRLSCFGEHESEALAS